MLLWVWRPRVIDRSMKAPEPHSCSSEMHYEQRGTLLCQGPFVTINLEMCIVSSSSFS